MMALVGVDGVKSRRRSRERAAVGRGFVTKQGGVCGRRARWSVDGLMMDFPLTVPYLLDRAARYFPGVEVVSRRPDRSVARSSYAEVRRRAHSSPARWPGWASAAAIVSRPWAGTTPAISRRISACRSWAGCCTRSTRACSRGSRLYRQPCRRLGPAGRRCAAAGAGATARTGEPASMSSSGRTVRRPPRACIDYEELIAAEPEEFAAPRLDEHEAACMCYTSGTTGRPKGVVYSHRAIVLHSLASAMADGLAIGQREVLCPVVPMFHVNAWGLPFTAHMVGCKQVLPGPHLDPREPARPVRSERVTLTRRRADDLARHLAGAGEEAGSLEARRDRGWSSAGRRRRRA